MLDEGISRRTVAPARSHDSRHGCLWSQVYCCHSLRLCRRLLTYMSMLSSLSHCSSIVNGGLGCVSQTLRSGVYVLCTVYPSSPFPDFSFSVFCKFASHSIMSQRSRNHHTFGIRCLRSRDQYISGLNLSWNSILRTYVSNEYYNAYQTSSSL
jgi:hypothetical protein